MECFLGQILEHSAEEMVEEMEEEMEEGMEEDFGEVMEEAVGEVEEVMVVEAMEEEEEDADLLVTTSSASSPSMNSGSGLSEREILFFVISILIRPGKQAMVRFPTDLDITPAQLIFHTAKGWVFPQDLCTPRVVVEHVECEEVFDILLDLKHAYCCCEWDGLCSAWPPSRWIQTAQILKRLNCSS
jgi:hypothetical protein